MKVRVLSLCLGLLTGLPAPAAVAAHVDELCELAAADFRRSASAQGLSADVRCRDTGAARTEAGLTAEPVSAAERPALRGGLVSWPLRLRRHDGTTLRRYVPLQVELRARAWVVRHDVAAGDSVRTSDLELREALWTAGVPPATADAPAGRLVRSLKAGDVVRAEYLLASDSARRGDPVQIVLRQGPFELRVPGQLLATGRVGENVQVQPQGRPAAAISGRLTSVSTVEARFE